MYGFWLLCFTRQTGGEVLPAGCSRPDARSVVPAPLAHALSLAYSQMKPYCWEIMPRPCHCRRVSALPKNSFFKPNGVPLHDLEEVVLALDGLEALRLADFEDLNMDEAAARMGVSRHTFGRLLRRARRSVAQALVLGQALRIEGGVYAVDAPDGQDAGDDAVTGDAAARGMLVAVPSLMPGGPEAAPNAHFGRCQVYTLARVENGQPPASGRRLRQPGAGPFAAWGKYLAGRRHGHTALAGFAGGGHCRVLQCQPAYRGRLS